MRTPKGWKREKCGDGSIVFTSPLPDDIRRKMIEASKNGRGKLRDRGWFLNWLLRR